MSKKRKYAAIVGVLALVGGALWMRELASWRPKFVGKVSFNPWQIRVSRDGKQLLLRGHNKEQNIDLESGAVDAKWRMVRDFEARHGLEIYPRVWIDEPKPELYFSRVRGEKLRLQSAFGSQGKMLFFSSELLNTHWSKAHNEVYGEAEGVIFTWNATDGKLKKRARYGKVRQRWVRFSPDGKWLFAVEREADKSHSWRRYEARSGKNARLVKTGADFFDFGFSPDGKWIYLVQSDGNPIFQVVRSADFQPAWGASWSGSVKWLADGRIGMVQRDRFEWRDASGRVLGVLPGPFDQLKGTKENLRDWTLSPDGKWIYSVDMGGTVRRWRSR